MSLSANKIFAGTTKCLLYPQGLTSQEIGFTLNSLGVNICVFLDNQFYIKHSFLILLVRGRLSQFYFLLCFQFGFCRKALFVLLTKTNRYINKTDHGLLNIDSIGSCIYFVISLQTFDLDPGLQYEGGSIPIRFFQFLTFFLKK